MADQDSNIKNIDEQALRQLRGLGWATESTLKAILQKADISARLMAELSKGGLKGQNAGAIDDLLKELRSSTRETKRSTTEQQSDRRGFSDLLKKSSIGPAARGARALGAMQAGMGVGQYDQPRITQGLATASRGIEQFGNVLSNNAGILGKTIGGMVGVFASLTIAAGGLIESLRTTTDMSRELYSKGLRPAEGGFASFVDAATESGLGLSAFSQRLGQFGAAAATLGTNRLQRLSGQIATMTNLGSDFIMTQGEMADAALETIEIMRQSGEIRGLTDQQIAGRSIEMAKTFDQLSQATGRNREELRRSTAELLRTTRMYGLQRTAGTQANGAIRGLITSLNAEFGREGASQLGEMVEGMFMGGAAGINEAMRPLLAIVPGFARGLEDVTAGIRSGTLDSQQASERMSQMFENMDENQLRILRMARPELYNFIRTMQQSSQAAREERTRRANLSQVDREKEDKAREDLQKSQAAFNTFNQGLSAVGNTARLLLGDLAVALEPMLKDFGKGLTEATRTVRNQLEPYFRRFGDYLRDNMTTILKNLGDTFASVYEWFAAGNMQKIWDALKEFGSFVGSAALAMNSFARTVGSLLGGGTGTGYAVLVAGLLAAPVIIAAAGALVGVLIARMGFGALGRLGGGGGGAAGAVGGGLRAAAPMAAAFSSSMIAAAPGIAVVTAAIIGLAGALRLAAPAFEPIGEMIKKVFEGGAEIIGGFARVVDTVGQRIGDVVRAFGDLRTGAIDATTRQIQALSDIPSQNLMESARGIAVMKEALAGFSPGIFRGLSEGLARMVTGDPAVQLERLGRAGMMMGEGAANIASFRANMAELVNVFDSSALERLNSVGLTIDRIGSVFRQGINARQIQPMVQGIASAMREVRAATEPAETPGAVPVITTSELNVKTVRYYEESMMRFNTMIELLEKNNIIVERTREDANSNSDRMTSAISRIGPTV